MREAAMNNVQTQEPVRLAEVIEFPRKELITILESNVESRLEELTGLVEGFSDSALNLFLTEKTAVREAIEELVVKVSALDWIVRVAKRSTGPVRQGLWMDIEKSLADLEETASFIIRATEKWAQSDTSGRRERVVCLQSF
jgi:hypothetical protein